MHNEISHLMDEVMEVEKQIQEESVRRTEVEKQIFEALGNCDFKRVNDLLESIEDGKLLGLQNRFDKLREKVKILTKGGIGKC